jgi:hypothetical protein
MFSGKGEFQAFAGVGLGINAQAAYALTDNIGVAANYLYINDSEANSSTIRKHQAGEIAIGYYKNLKSDLCFEIYAGYGRGKGEAIDTSFLLPFVYDLYAKGFYQKIFVQPAIGSNKNRFNWNVSLKFSLVDFSKINLIEDDEVLLNNVSPKLFLTPAISLSYRIWPKNLSATFQTGINAHVGSRTIYDYDFLMASFGFTYTVRPKIKTP